MKTILIPTDLSPESENALAYAVEFSLSVPEKIKLILLHVFETSVANVDTTAALMLTDLGAIEQETIDSINQMMAKHTRATGLNCSVVTSRGFLENEIIAIAKQHHADYIFMGTTGAKGFFSGLMGSNTSGVIEVAPCPVLAIPAKAMFSPIRKIVFASNFSENDTADFSRVVKLAGLYNSTIVLLHLSDKEEEVLDLQVLEFVRNQIKNKTGYAKIEVAAIHAHSFVDGLEKEIAKHNAAMLVMAPRKHGFIDNLLGRSRTKQMVLHTKTPLLALPLAADAESLAAPGNTSLAGAEL